MAQWRGASRRATVRNKIARGIVTKPNPKFSRLPVDADVLRKRTRMNFELSVPYRLGILLAISGFCATLAGCVNKAQPNFERPPAPVVVSTAVSQDV
jgi:hypothetical protein